MAARWVAVCKKREIEESTLMVDGESNQKNHVSCLLCM